MSIPFNKWKKVATSLSALTPEDKDLRDLMASKIAASQQAMVDQLNANFFKLPEVNHWQEYLEEIDADDHPYPCVRPGRPDNFLFDKPLLALPCPWMGKNDGAVLG